jgi:hypothetical protein
LSGRKKCSDRGHVQLSGGRENERREREREMETERKRGRERMRVGEKKSGERMRERERQGERGGKERGRERKKEERKDTETERMREVGRGSGRDRMRERRGEEGQRERERERGESPCIIHTSIFSMTLTFSKYRCLRANKTWSLRAVKYKYVLHHRKHCAPDGFLLMPSADGLPSSHHRLSMLGVHQDRSSS